MKVDISRLIKICFFNLLIIAILGVLMRYKIGFEFPYFNQKNIQHAHSHFAFAGWISLVLMALMVYNIKDLISTFEIKSFNLIFLFYLFSAYGMLVGFFVQGYGLFSIFFSSLSIIISFWFCLKYYFVAKKINAFKGKNWFVASLFFNALSSIGTLYLSYKMASKQIDQHSYLASLYWYLHFQYNGWFFFACAGLFINYLQVNKIILKAENYVFYLLVVSCVPAYGLSVLWMEINNWFYFLIVTAAIAQSLAISIFFVEINRIKLNEKLKNDFIIKSLLFCVAIALIIKTSLQLGSTIPAISKFAFGFRPIVIAYLHLVLLAFTTVFLLTYVYMSKLIEATTAIKLGIVIFVLGIFLNEAILAIQGIASISYTVIPYANESLFFIALLILLGLAIINLNLAVDKKQIKS